MEDCLFCKIARKTESSYTVWEDGHHQAFLTPFPNTPGFTVVITKEHYPSYGFAVPEKILLSLILAAKKVALQIDRNLQVARTGLIIEGYGVNHLHVKLFPMHGIDTRDWKPIGSVDRTFYPTYRGMIASNDGPPMLDSELREIAQKIRGK